MAANSHILRPLGIFAGGLGSFQAITWGILSLLGILAYAGVINVPPYASNQFQRALFDMYFNPTVTIFEEWSIMTPGLVLVWMIIYFGTSLIWLTISVFLLHDSYKSNFTYNIIMGWVTFSVAVVVIDFAGTVAFGVDYDRAKRYPVPNSYGTELYLAPIFMMIMCARGFIFWVMNFGLVICLNAAARNLNKTGSPNLLQEPEKLRHDPSFNSHYYNSMGANLYSSHKADPSSQGRQNSTFQPDPIYGWDTQTPTVGNQQPSQRDFPAQDTPPICEVVNPITPIPRVGIPIATPIALQQTPKPDYSPPTRHKVQH